MAVEVPSELSRGFALVVSRRGSIDGWGFWDFFMSAGWADDLGVGALDDGVSGVGRSQFWTFWQELVGLRDLRGRLRRR